MMRYFPKGGFLAIFLLFSSFLFAQDVVLVNQNILSQKVENEINLIGKELLDKSDIFVGVIAVENNLSHEVSLWKERLPSSYVLLLLSKNEHKVDIIGSKGAMLLFDREQVLSPFPNTGTILPILATNKGDIYNAAILNGYGDIVDQIAKSRSVVLENSIGNANRDTINILRILIYGFICFALLYFVQRRVKRRKS